MEAGRYGEEYSQLSSKAKPLETRGWLHSSDVNQEIGLMENLLKLWSCPVRLPQVVTCSLKRAVRKDLIKSLK
jgi:hypothetical protein